MKAKYRVYEKAHVKNHPQFGSGIIGVHRLKIYEKYGENLPDCEICKEPVFWAKCHVDHIDNDPKNNDIDNLRPLHHGCNTSRQNVQGSKHAKGTLPNEALKLGFVSCSQAAKYAGTTQQYLRICFKENPGYVIDLLNSAKKKMDMDPSAKRLTAKQRYDAAMYADGFIRIQGWIKPENKAAVQEFFETKAGLDYEAGDHLIKKGEKRAKKEK